MGLVRNWWLCVCLLWSSSVMAGPTLSHPDVSLGSNPIQNFSGGISVGETATLLAVPAGQEFVITSFLQYGEALYLKKNDETAVWWWALGRAYFSTGLSRVRFESGSVLSVGNDGREGPDKKSYYIEGYLTAEGSPYRHWTGDISGATPVEVFTNDESDPFVIRTILLGDWNCAVYHNDDMVLQPLMIDNNERSNDGFTHRRGNMLIPPGLTVKIAAPTGAGCEYYVEGEYVRP